MDDSAISNSKAYEYLTEQSSIEHDGASKATWTELCLGERAYLRIQRIGEDHTRTPEKAGKIRKSVCEVGLNINRGENLYTCNSDAKVIRINVRQNKP